MKLSAKVDPRITSWMEKKREKYLHHNTQNEIIRLMAFIIFRKISTIVYSTRYWPMIWQFLVKREQFFICFRWVDKGFDTHEEFIGIYDIDNIKADVSRKIPHEKIPTWNIPTHFINCLSSLFLHLILRPSMEGKCTCSSSKDEKCPERFNVPTWEKIAIISVN